MGWSETNFTYTVKFTDPENPLLEVGGRMRNISHRSSVIANFLLKFSNSRCHGNRGWSETNFCYTVKFADPVNLLVGAIIGGVSSIQAELY